ncbi:MAG: 4'-phosphopantetheinyl transferase superfamily protein [Pseudonocardiaceae bacterium]|nr:4'-phosphopantetheinyl transferase superfamily protein [Pseudonocardiaceae bacterium]
MQRLLPAAAACAELRGAGQQLPVHPEEAPFVAGAIPARRREFAAARGCARRALAELGIEPVAILPGDRREPCWPPGVVGSLTHCTGYCAAAVAGEDEIAALGIDAEINEVLPEGVHDSVATSNERDLLRTLAQRDPTVCWDRVLFSAKESVYKAWYPMARRWLGFLDVALHIDPAAGTFTARIVLDQTRGNRKISRLAGRWAADDGLIRTAAWLHR